jgi:cell wall hydrolase
MHVVMNRLAAPDFPKTISAVINQPNAFSWTRPDNPEYGRDPAVSTGLDLEMWEAALHLAEEILNGDDADPTGGACYYEASWATSGWFARHIAGPDLMGTPGHEFTVEIGGQRYYRWGGTMILEIGDQKYAVHFAHRWDYQIEETGHGRMHWSTHCALHEGICKIKGCAEIAHPYYGAAFCHENDQFSKRVGRKLAMSRAIKPLPRSLRQQLWAAYFKLSPIQKGKSWKT